MSPRPTPSPRLITPGKAVQSARRIVNQLRTHPLWAPALGSAQPAEDALLVRRLDLADSYYYVVACASEGRVTARVLIDALSAALVEIGAVSVTARSLRKWILPTEVVTVVLANTGAIYEARVRTPDAPLIMRREAITVPSVLSWKPCDESRSRFLPFYAVALGDQIVYVRVDAKFFPSLNTNVSG